MSAFRPDVLKVRDYVTANDAFTYDLLPDDVVALTITHSNLPAKHLDIRFNLHLTISEVKDKLRKHIGTPPEFQTLVLKHNGHVLRELSENSRMLGFYSPESGMEVHIKDSDPYSLSKNGGLTDVSLIEKFKISDEQYDKRKDTVRSWIKKKKAENPFFKPPKVGEAMGEQAAAASCTSSCDDCGAESVNGMTVGDRCEVQPGARRGTVKFVGEVEQLQPGYWVGVQLDEPLGKNNGTIKGIQLFECPDGHGTLVRGKNIRVGDFPERDILADEDEEETEI